MFRAYEDRSKPHVLVMAPDGSETEYVLRAINTIGRHPDQHIQILDRVVSKKHALITSVDGAFYLQDMGSRNGTYINNVRIKGRTRLHDHDTILLGSTRILFFDSHLDRMPNMSSLVRILQPQLTTDTATLSRLTPENSSTEFLPEDEIRDVSAMRRDYEKLRIAFKLNQAIGAEYDFDRVLQRILETVFETTSADRAVIFIMDENGNPEPCAAQNRDGSKHAFGISRTILNEVIACREGVLSSDATNDSRFSASNSIIIQNIRSTMCVPLMFQDELFGLIHLDTRLATGVFTEKDLQLLTVFAQQAALKLANTRLAHRAEQGAIARHNLSRLLSPNLVEMVVNGTVAMDKTSGKLTEATILFADIRGFTAMSERMEPTAVVSILNEYFEIMADIVFQHDGTLDKFVGDEIMAVWGCPVHQDDHVDRALAAAIEMRDALQAFNRFRKANNEIPLHVGIGLNSGPVVAGYMGSTRALSYTVIGDTVNTASRLCSLAQSDEILTSQTVVNSSHMGNVRFERGPDTLLKGKSKPIEIYAVQSDNDDSIIE